MAQTAKNGPTQSELFSMLISIKMEEEKKQATIDVPPRDIESQRPTSTMVDGKRMLYKPDDEFEMKSCCGSICTVDKPLLEFISKTIVSLSVLTFCFIQLSKGSQSEFASSTISLILGTYLGGNINPSKQDKKK